MFIPRWYQTESLNSTIEYFSLNDKGNPLLVMPTGTGKSWVIAMLMQWITTNYSSTRIMMLTHVKELIEQDYEKIQKLWPESPTGVYSAGLNKRDRDSQIVFAGVKSVLNEIQRSYTDQADIDLSLRHFGRRDIIIVDEAHLISPCSATTYRKVFEEFKKLQPHLRVIGLTATPYRLGQGLLTAGKTPLFTDVCYDLSTKDNINRLVGEGHMAPLVSRPVNIHVDTSNISIDSWDFNSGELSKEIQKVMYPALLETVQVGAETNRNSCMVFCSSVENCETAVKILHSFGVSAECVHSKKKPKENKRLIEAFKAFEIKVLVSNNKLTTGFDHPGLDLICMLRATVSPGLWCQMLGRGTRAFECKENCMVLDYGNNIARLGPFNDIRIPKEKSDKIGDAPVKICPQAHCQQLNHCAARECAYCGHKFPIRVNIDNSASTDKIMAESDFPRFEVFNVSNVFFTRHQKPGKKACLKVVYVCGLKSFNHWLFLEAGGLVGNNARDWWRLHSANEPPKTTDEAMTLINLGELKKATAIEVHINKKYPEIKNFYF